MSWSSVKGTVRKKFWRRLLQLEKLEYLVLGDRSMFPFQELVRRARTFERLTVLGIWAIRLEKKNMENLARMLKFAKVLKDVRLNDGTPSYKISGDSHHNFANMFYLLVIRTQLRYSAMHQNCADSIRAVS